mgnify:FL=1
MELDYVALGERIRQRRQEKGLTLKDSLRKRNLDF